MSKDSLLEYLLAISLRYKNATKRQKSKILDEFCATTGYERKHAIKLVGGKRPARSQHPGPRPVYDAPVREHIVALWQLMRRMCSKRMAAALPIWLEYYDAPGLTDEIRGKLRVVSPATLDRVLKANKAEFRKGLTATKPGAFLKSQIPIELLDRHVTHAGFIEADTVAHCGNSLRGTFANTLTLTDLLSGWTVNRAMWGKTAQTVLERLRDTRCALPFRIAGFACDNGSEFINESLVAYLENHQDGRVKFTRRRPYKKNDAAHVEQKNDACVRQLIGYSRIDDPNLVPLLDEIYTQYWNPLLNFFCPVLKLKQKIRIGGRTRKIYDRPRTPYDRLMDHDVLTELQRQRLQTTRAGLNPIELKKSLDRKLELLFKKIRELSIGKEGSSETPTNVAA